MMEKYHITDDGFGETYTFRLDNNALPLKRGWWIVYLGTSEVYGLTLVYWRTMSDEKFRQTYREEESSDKSGDKKPTGGD